MLLHITPRFFTCATSGSECELVDLRIEELDLLLKGGEDLVCRRPYPNKRYIVACRKQGQKAIEGILVDADRSLPAYTVTARWAIAAELLVTHRITYQVLDDDFDTVSDKMVLWYRMSEGLGGWGSRWPDAHKGVTPAQGQPRMQATVDERRLPSVKDRVLNGLILERTETFAVPTIERARLLQSPVWERNPSIESAFKVR